MRNQTELQYYSVTYEYVLVPSFHRYDAMCFPILPKPCLSFASHQKIVNDFYQVEINEPGYDRTFLYHPMLNTHSNQEHDNAIHHPPLPESIEQLVERIINYVTV